MVDRAAFRLVSARGKRPDAEVLARVEGELRDARLLFEQRGWVDAPATYHLSPPAPDGVRTRPTRSGNFRYTTVSWVDGFECRPEEPGAERYATYRPNRIARAALLEHRSTDRPWLVCLHGFGMGSPGLDLRAFRALHLHRSLGLNLAFLTLPFHGKRNPGGARSAPAVPGADMLDNLHGIAQSVWDVRQLFQLIRQRTAQPIGVMGLSLGGYVAATVASLDDPYAVILLVPAVDLLSLMEHAGERMGGIASEAADLASLARPVMTAVSPLALKPRVPLGRRTIVAATLDQFTPPSSQALALWHHWDQPDLQWYHGGHVSLFWSPTVRRAIDTSLTRLGLIEGPRLRAASYGGT